MVSDWASIEQLTAHGFAADDRQAAFEAATAGLNMEMATSTYREYLPELIESGQVGMEQIDALVRRLRQRLAEVEPEHDFIVTVRGYGFRVDNSVG